MKVLTRSCVLVLALSANHGAIAQTFEEFMVAHERKDYTASVAGFRSLAERGDARSQYFLAVMYNNGFQGIAQDAQQAVVWFRKAAEQGHELSQIELGNMYYNGRGIAKDEKQAELWFSKPAEQGNVKAKEMLNRMKLAPDQPTWTQFTDNEVAATYFDRTSITKAGNVAQMWDLIDIKKAVTSQGKTYNSMKWNREYDCSDNKYRWLSISFYSKAMGNGERVHNNPAGGKWEPVPSGTVRIKSMEEVLFEAACK